MASLRTRRRLSGNPPGVQPSGAFLWSFFVLFLFLNVGSLCRFHLFISLVVVNTPVMCLTPPTNSTNGSVNGDVITRRALTSQKVERQRGCGACSAPIQVWRCHGLGGQRSFWHLTVVMWGLPTVSPVQHLSSSHPCRLDHPFRY